MTEDASDRRATSSSEPCIDSDPDELLSELASTLMTPNEASRETGEDLRDKWRDGAARGDKFGRAGRRTR
jgi:hypothetical protein